jgi:hypothetical protein
MARLNISVARSPYAFVAGTAETGRLEGFAAALLPAGWDWGCDLPPRPRIRLIKVKAIIGSDTAKAQPVSLLMRDNAFILLLIFP